MAKRELEITIKTKGVDKASKDIDKLGDSAETSASKLAATKTQVVAIAASLVALGASLFKVFQSITQFNRGLATIATLIPNNRKRIEEMRSDIQALSIQMGSTTDDLVDGMFQVVSAFGDSAEAAEQLRIVAAAAAAGGATTAESLALLSAVTKGYGDTTAVALEKAADLAFMTNKLGQTTFPELASSMGRVVPLASTLNTSQEELFATFATLTGVTGKAAEVSTQMAGVLQGLLKPTADMDIALKKLGVENIATTIAQDGLVQTLKNAIATTDGSTAATAKLFGSVEALNAVLALTGSQADVFNDKFAQMQKASGAAEQAFKDMTEGVNKTGFESQKLSSMFTVLIQIIGQKLDPVFSAFIRAAQIGVQALTSTVEALAHTWNVFFDRGAEADAFDKSNVRLVELNEQLVRNIKMFGEGSIQVLATERQITEQRAKHQAIIKGNVAELRKELGLKKELIEVDKTQIVIAPPVVTAAEKIAVPAKREELTGFAEGEFPEIVRMQELNQMKLNELALFQEQELQMAIAHGASISEQERIRAEQSAEFTKVQNDFRLKTAAKTAGALANVAQNLNTAMGGESKTAFKAMKAFALAEAAISGGRAIVSSFAAGSAIGGPIVGAAFAAAAAAATAAQIQQIKSQQLGGGGGAVSVAGSATPPRTGGGQSAQGVPVRLEEEQVKGKQEINITFQADGIIAKDTLAQMSEDLIKVINEAGDENLLINARAVAT